MSYHGVTIFDLFGKLATLVEIKKDVYDKVHGGVSTGVTWETWEITRNIANCTWKLTKESIVKQFLWENALTGKR